ncbi:MAG: NUDIX domain-containing protein [Candidatus Thorarchaeota archaeon]|nr:NUDIX domain-containing protein [Candidatus Thorarchaeota archaeon]
MNDRRFPKFPIPGIGVVVFGRKGVLLVRRDKDPGKGLWSIPGGGVEIGESQETAAIREVLEETGISCEVIQLLTTADIITPNSENEIEYHFILNHYLARGLTEEVTPESSEAEVRWFSAYELPEDEMIPEIVDLIKDALNYLE